MAKATYRVCTLPGDGIGPEIMAEGKKVLAAVGEKANVDFVCEDHLIGGAAIDALTGRLVMNSRHVHAEAAPTVAVAGGD